MESNRLKQTYKQNNINENNGFLMIRKTCLIKRLLRKKFRLDCYMNSWRNEGNTTAWKKYYANHVIVVVC